MFILGNAGIQLLKADEAGLGDKEVTEDNPSNITYILHCNIITASMVMLFEKYLLLH